MKWIISLRTFAALSLFWMMFAAEAFGFDHPSHAQIPDFDKRAKAAQEKELKGERAAAADRLKQRVPRLKIDLDEVRGAPKFVAAADGFLSGRNGEGRGISAEKIRALPGNDAHRPIKAFLNEHAALYGHGAEVLTPARVKRDDTGKHNGLRTTVWEQQLDNIAVYEAVMIGHITRQGELVNLASQFVPDLERAADAGTPNRAALAAAPTISSLQAMLNAAEIINENLEATAIVPLDAEPQGAEKRQRFKAGHLPGEAELRLIWLPIDRTSMRLCWQVELIRPEGGERFRVLIDAQNGEALLCHRLTVYLSDATFRIFPGDSPTPFSPGFSSPSTNQPSLAARSLVTLKALSTNGSPLGWINDGENQTRGNNVDAHLDANADDEPDLPRPQGAPYRVFDFPIDFNQSPTNYSDAAVVQLFYWCNWVHDQLYDLGFTEAAGNYQKDNFGRGGRGNDAIQADAQDGSGFNNANFTPTEDGVPGRIQMFLFTGPEPDRDGDFDAEVVLHEYVHGLSTRLVGGGAGITQLQTGGMGEGWSDFYALALLSEAGEDLNGTYAAGAYASFQFFGLGENYYFGIRRYPYSTDMTKNPLTFKDIDPNQIDPHVNVPSSPIQPFNPLFANEVHAAGEVWCVTLWEMRANLIRKHGFAAGNRLTLQLVTDGMKLSPPNPNFLQARDAIIQADIVLTGGANWNELWGAFAKRGMGFSAFSPPSSSTFGVMEAYDLPDALLIIPTTPFLSSGPEKGPLAPACKTYTLTNHSTFTFAWSASATQPWLTITPASGSLAPGQGAKVEVCVTSAANNLAIGSHQDVITFSNHTTQVTQQREVNVRIMRFAAMPFVEDFESGVFQPHWIVTGKGGFRSQVTQQSVPHGGLHHLVMDNNGSGDFSRNEVTLGIDLAGFTNVVLRFWAKNLGDEPDGPPLSPFIGGADFDGVAISSDGVAWYEVQSLRNLQVNHSQWVVDLDEAVRARGLSYGPSFRIRFNQYDNLSVPFDGIAVDDISITGIAAFRLALSIPAEATEGDGVLLNQGRISVALPVPRDVVVNLASSDLSKATVPATATIRAGTTQAVFNVSIVDNNLLDGTQPVTISASAAGYFERSLVLMVNDNDTATLKVMLPRPRGREGDPPLNATVRSSSKAARNILVGLTSSNTNELTVLPSVILPAGKNSVDFPIFIVDDNRIDGTQYATITAHVENWIDDSVTVEIRDNDLPSMTVKVPASASEGNGTLTNAGQVSLASSLPTALVVSLSSSAPADLIVPSSVTIPAGEFSATFHLTVVDDAELEGLQNVTVNATASGFAPASAIMAIIDDETPPLPYDPSPPDRSSDNPVAVDLSWRGGFGEIVVNGGFETGDFTGWHQENIDYGFFVINDGKLDPEGPDGPLPPFEGEFNAMLEQIGGGRHLLYQDVLIPADAKSALFTWAHRIRNHGLQFSPRNQEFRVEIRDTANNLLELAYTTKPGDPVLNDWVQRSLDLTRFRGRTIRLAFFEEDHLGYFNVHVDNVSVVLGSTGTTTFDVYFGTNAVPGPAQFLGTTTNANWELPTLALNTTYYWRVVSKRGAAQVTGPVWQFTTRGVGALHHFEWSAIPGTQFVDQPFPVTLTAKDDLNNTVENFSGNVQLTGVAGAETASAVVVTEVDPGNTDRVEFANVSGRRLDISGWQISLYDGRTWPGPRITFTVPTNTSCPRGALFTLTVTGTAPGAFPSFVAGTNVTWGNGVVSNQVAVLVRDAAGRVADFMCAVEATAAQVINPLPLPAEEWMGNSVAANTNLAFTFQRIGSVDRNDNTDWIITTNSVGRFNTGLARTFQSRIPLSIFPTNVAFAGGVWTGNLTVQNLIPSMLLRAEDGGGHFALSNPFAVTAANDVSLSITDSPDLVIFGDDLTYTIVVSNTGPATATGVTVIDDLPEGVTLVSATSSQGNCFTLQGDVWCPLGSLAAGGGATVTIVVTPNITGQLLNAAFVTHVAGDPYLPNNAAVAVSTVNLPLLFISSPNVTEGHTGSTNEVFNVRLTAPSRLPITVEYATADITATAGVDYVPTAGTLVFPPGTISQTITVRVNGDRLDEVLESFNVNLFSPVNAGLLVGQGRGRITDDDQAPTLFVGDAIVTEGPPGTSTNITFNVRLNAVSGLAVSANYTTGNRTALASKDYVAKSGVVIFPPGVTNQTITIAVNGDTIFESNETFVVTLNNLMNSLLGDIEGVGTIQDNGFVDLDHFSFSTVPSPQYAGVPFTVTVTARDGRDNPFAGFSGSVALSALAGSREATFGTGTNIWENPMGTEFHDGRTQIIYLAGELGGAGLISALALNVTTPPSQTLSNWTIRLKHTALSSYGQPAWETGGWTTVYGQHENISGAGWTLFFFDSPFAYNGTDNLMVDLSFDNSSYTVDGQCRVSSTTQPRAVYFRSDSAFGDPLSWTGTVPPPAVAKQVPHIRFLVETPVAITPNQSGNFVNGTWTGAITVQEAATNVFLRALGGGRRVGTGNLFAVESLVDTDNDGLPDSWEQRHFGSLNGGYGGAQEDADGDGLSNLQEFRAGTDPRDAVSTVRITAARWVGGRVKITFPSVAGKSYRIERSESLTNASWMILADKVAGTGVEVEVFARTEGAQSGFYRVRVIP